MAGVGIVAAFDPCGMGVQADSCYDLGQSSRGYLFQDSRVCVLCGRHLQVSYDRVRWIAENRFGGCVLREAYRWWPKRRKKDDDDQLLPPPLTTIEEAAA